MVSVLRIALDPENRTMNDTPASPHRFIDPFELPTDSGPERAPSVPADDGAEIGGLRGRIDELDANVRALLHARAALAVRIGQLKRARGEPVRADAREDIVLARAREDDAGAMPGLVLEDVFRVVVDACRRVQTRPRVACLGPVGSFSHVAVRQRFGTTAQVVALPSIAEVVDATARGEVDHGLVPAHARSGRIVETHAAVARHAARVRVTSEFRVAVAYRLVGHGPLGRVVEVRSRPEVLQACAPWLAAHLPHVRTVVAVSTSAAVRDVARDADHTLAAIGSTLAASLYGVAELARIEDADGPATTTFWLVRAARVDAQP
jgi:chorismate mutase/prephenate dehydratase